MNEEEIVRSYQTAKTPNKQIAILAELNATTTQEIKVILARNGLITYTPPPPKPPKPIKQKKPKIRVRKPGRMPSNHPKHDEIYRLWKIGMSYRAIAEIVDMPYSTVYYQVQKIKSSLDHGNGTREQLEKTSN